jgi:hypothetical protein
MRGLIGVEPKKDWQDHFLFCIFGFSADLFARIRLQLAFQRSRIHHLQDCLEILVRNSLKSTESRCHFVHVGRGILIDDNVYRMFVTCFPLFQFLLSLSLVLTSGCKPLTTRRRVLERRHDYYRLEHGYKWGYQRGGIHTWKNYKMQNFLHESISTRVCLC